MKIVIVVTSHDQLGSTGRKTGFWLEEFAAPYFVFSRRRHRVDAGVPKWRTAADRSQKRRTGKPNTRDGALQAGRESTERAISDGQARDHKIRALRHDLLCRGSRPDVGPR